MTEFEAKALIKKYNQGLASPAEAALLQYWYIVYANRPGIPEVDYNVLSQELRPQIVLDPKKVNIRLWPGIAAAASIVLILGIGLLYFGIQKNMFGTHQNVAFKNDVAPGGNKAYLTLADGRKVSLSDADTGAIARQAGVSIRKTAAGEIVYSVVGAQAILSKNTITTPKGGTWLVRLPDGTSVWLNATSSLTYPASFAGQKDRRVRLTGEGYFEVAKDKSHPFIVTTDRQDVEVLGTHFNINSYEEEGSVKTTLLEGSVKVLAYASSNLSFGPKGETIVLKPNEQADLGQFNRITVKQVDAQNSIDWKEGKFRFKNEQLTSILRKVSRWYDVQIVYQADKSKLPTFSGSVSRSENVSAVLEKLQETSKIQFEINGRTIIVK